MNDSTRSHSQTLKNLTISAGVALAALLALITTLWWSDRQQQIAFVDLRASTQNIRIQRAGFDDIVLQKQSEEQWSINEPCSLEANPQRLQPLLDALQPASHSYPASEVDREAAGLLQPEAVIFLNGQALSLGKTDLSEDRRYVQRGERVEFAPEWILSLVNGGLSALARLEVFPKGLDSLVFEQNVDSNEALAAVTAEHLAQWQSLSAQQIVTWPINSEEATTAPQRLRALTAGQTRTVDVYQFPRFIALHIDNGACAYILAKDSLPDEPSH